MDNDTYEQINVDKSYFGDQDKFLKESEEVELLHDDKDAIVIAETPIFVQLEVTETEPGFRGDTATNVMKPATLETGAVVPVPIFVNTGDLLKIDTRAGKYVERVKN